MRDGQEKHITTFQRVAGSEAQGSPVLDLTVDLAGVPEGYRAMDTRKAIKVMVRV